MPSGPSIALLSKNAELRSAAWSRVPVQPPCQYQMCRVESTVESFPTGEQIWHIEDSQRQILALTVLYTFGFTDQDSGSRVEHGALESAPTSGRPPGPGWPDCVEQAGQIVYVKMCMNRAGLVLGYLRGVN